jgi:hypothetical protein
VVTVGRGRNAAGNFEIPVLFACGEGCGALWLVKIEADANERRIEERMLLLRF